MSRRSLILIALSLVLACMSSTAVVEARAVNDRGNTEVEKGLLRSVRKLEDNGGDDDDSGNGVQPTCPYVADEYDIEFLFGGQKIEIKFAPIEYGIEAGYYCSLSTSFGESLYRYSFGNCTCGFLARCNDEWGEADIQILGAQHRFNVGQCQPKAWIVVCSSLIGLAFVLLVGRALYRVICARRAKYTITEVYEERLLPSDAAQGQATNQVAVERTRTVQVSK